MSSQYNEDEIISNFFGADYIGTFLDIGAGDGVFGSNSLALINRGWSGACVEPHAESFTALWNLHRHNHSVELMNFAVSGIGLPRLRFYPQENGQLSTGIETLTELKEFYWVASVKPGHFLYRTWDFVSIDCEGMDMEILAESRNLLKDTKLLCYEHDKLREPGSSAYSKLEYEIIFETLGFTRVVGMTEGNTLVARP